MARKPVLEERQTLSHRDSRLDIALPIRTKKAVALAAALRGCSMQQIVDEALLQHRDVQSAMKKLD